MSFLEASRRAHGSRMLTEGYAASTVGLERRWDGSAAKSKTESGLAERLPESASGKRMCGSVECPNRWTMPWKNRRRPIFESKWGCGENCLRQMVRAAVRRETGEEQSGSPGGEHRHRMPLGLVMLAQGWITQDQLRRALDLQRQHGSGRIGQWLTEECGIGAAAVTRALSVQWGCPVLTLEGYSPREMALVMPKALVEAVPMIPLRVAGSKLLYLAFRDRLDASSALAIQQMTELKVETGLLDEAMFDPAKRALLACVSIPTSTESVANVDVMSERIARILEKDQPVCSRLVRLHRFHWLRTWLECGAIGAAGTLPGHTEDMRDYLFTIDPVRGKSEPVRG